MRSTSGEAPRLGSLGRRGFIASASGVAAAVSIKSVGAMYDLQTAAVEFVA